LEKKSGIGFHQVKQYAENIFVGNSILNRLKRKKTYFTERIPESGK
jgi:hypothetical protein